MPTSSAEALPGDAAEASISVGSRWLKLKCSSSAPLPLSFRTLVIAGMAASQAQISDMTEVVFQSDNPKTVGTATFERYEQYKQAKTVGEAKRLGATSADIKTAIDKGHATVTNAATGTEPAHDTSSSVGGEAPSRLKDRSGQYKATGGKTDVADAAAAIAKQEREKKISSSRGLCAETLQEAKQKLTPVKTRDGEGTGVYDLSPKHFDMAGASDMAEEKWPDSPEENSYPCGMTRTVFVETI